MDLFIAIFDDILYLLNFVLNKVIDWVNPTLHHATFLTRHRELVANA